MINALLTLLLNLSIIMLVLIVPGGLIVACFLHVRKRRNQKWRS
jgi:hypothetical protein